MGSFIFVSKSPRQWHTACGGSDETANMLGGEPDERVMNEVNKLSQDFLDKLEEVGLIEVQDKNLFQLKNFLEHVEQKEEKRFEGGQIAETTYNKIRYIKDHFLAFMTKEQGYSADCDIRKITVQDCKDYKDNRLSVVKSATVETEIKKLRQIFFTVAVDMRLLRVNPFAKIKVDTKEADTRREYISANRLHNAWKSIPTKTAKQRNHSCWFALLRWTGARRSEPLLLKWKMVDWEINRITMPAPKTAHCGVPERVMPIFEELKPILEKQWDDQGRPSPESYVIQDIMNLPKTNRQNVAMQKNNPTTQWKRWLAASRVEPWLKFAQNMRVTRENELLQSQEYRSEAVHSFIGHSRDTYEKNYKELNDNDYVRLSDRSFRRSTTVLPRNGQRSATSEGSLSYDKKIDPHLAGLGGGCDELGSPLAPPVGLEPTTMRLTAARSTN